VCDEGLRVGVVDSGCSVAQRDRVVGAAGFELVDGELRIGEASLDRLGHGSELIAVIDALAPGVQFLVAQVFRERLSTSARQVAAAIDWLVDQHVQIINLSLGLSEDRAMLAAACERALRAGVLICAASPARGAPVYPAAYPGVFRMTGDARCGREEISHLETRYADFGAHVRPLDGKLGGAGASLGCAHLCAHVARYLAAGGSPRLSEVRRALIAQARFRGPEQRHGSTQREPPSDPARGVAL
jgi:hypothetical protein